MTTFTLYPQTHPVISTTPQSAKLDAFQAKAVLAQYGLLEDVQTLIDDPATPTRIKLAWDNAVPFRRDNPLVLMVAEQLELSPELLDELFSVGARITPDEL